MSAYQNTGAVINGILKVLVVAGMAGTAVIAPNAVQLGEPILKYLDKRGRKKELNRVLKYMDQRSLSNFKELPDGQLIVTITEKGRRRVEKINFDEMRIDQPVKWDRKWRLVMFDIPEFRRKYRSAFSRKLRSLGLYQMQKSVWVCPYPCLREIQITKQVLGIPDVELAFAELSFIDREVELRKHFNL